MQSLTASATGKLVYSVLELMIGEKLLTGGAKKAGVAAGNSAANVVGDLILDTALDTVPNAAADAADGLEGGEIASNAVKSVGKNLRYNMLAEGAVALPNVVGKIKSRWQVAAGDALDDAARHLDDVKESARVLDDVADASKYADEVIEGGGKSVYDEKGNYTGGRSAAELSDLANDPAHAGSQRQIDIDKGIHEREVGLSLEESGKITGPITRDPSGKAEFIDANGQAWDIKSFNSNYKPKQGGYTLQKSMDEIYDSWSKNENVILDATNLSDADKTELLKEINDKGLSDQVIVWP